MLLYNQIEFQKVTTMNEKVPESGMKVLEKTWDSRLEPVPSLTSDADEQLLMMIPYDMPLDRRSLTLIEPVSQERSSSTHYSSDPPTRIRPQEH